jgi:hypothetical protein
MLQNGLKVYKCSIYEEGWGTEYLQEREIILAHDADEARAMICRQWQVRKNKKGLKIEEIPFNVAKYVTKTKTELIPETSYNVGLGHFDTSHYGKVTRYYCGHCNSEIKTLSNFCKSCGSYLKG